MPENMQVQVSDPTMLPCKNIAALQKRIGPDLKYSAFTPTELSSFGITVIIAPHPDDESLGCGGTIALLRDKEIPVQVIFVSDGSMSHPRSTKYPAGALARLRESEAIKALDILGVTADNVRFMCLKDSQVPFAGAPGFKEAVDLLQMHLLKINPDTCIIPWRRDPHADHRACRDIAAEAITQFQKPVRLLEYPIWLWERGENEDYPTPGETLFKISDISFSLDLKKKAIAAHQSQVSRLIDDDPEGFWLSPGVIAHFTEPCEIFFENINPKA